MRASSGRAIVLSLALLSACAEPPNKEMDQAQGALDAARAAGAEQYATEELRAAATALANARRAVADRDYRLALSQAIDARERAQEAAKQAAGQKAIVRSEAEKEITATRAAVQRASAQLKAAQTAKVAPRQLVEPRAAIAAADNALQKAGAALATEDYLGARAALDGVRARLDAATATLTDAAGRAARPPRRRS